MSPRYQPEGSDADTDTNTETEPLHFREVEADDDGHVRLEPGTVVHVTTLSHLERHLIEHGHAKRLIQRLLLRYARICRYAVLHYAIMDNHLHLVLRALPDCEPLDKMIGTLKAQFTHKFKAWFNNTYRPEHCPRRAEMGRGTLWLSYEAKIIDSDAYLRNCVFYVEANHLKAVHRCKIEALLEPPCATQEFEGPEDFVDGALGPDYDELLEAAKEWPYHSASYYLSEQPTGDPALTDGTDAVWATEEEVEAWWDRPYRELPDGWQKVYFGGRQRILKPTPEHERRYPECPVWAEVDDDRTIRARRFAVGLMESIWCSQCRERDDLPAPRRTWATVGPRFRSG